MDVNNQEIICVILTTNDYHDREVLQEIAEAIEGPIAKVGSVGAYESHANYDYLVKRKIKVLIPPRKNVRIKQRGNSQALDLARDKVVRDIRRLRCKALGTRKIQTYKYSPLKNNHTMVVFQGILALAFHRLRILPLASCRI